jgi:hypothetical protein
VRESHWMARIQEVWVVFRFSHELLLLSLHLFFRNVHHKVFHHIPRSQLVSLYQGSTVRYQSVWIRFIIDTTKDTTKWW